MSVMRVYDSIQEHVSDHNAQNQPARPLLDEFDIDLPSLAAWLVVVIIIVVGGGTDPMLLEASLVYILCALAVTRRNGVVVNGWRLGRTAKVRPYLRAK